LHHEKVFDIVRKVETSFKRDNRGLLLREFFTLVVTARGVLVIIVNSQANFKLSILFTTLTIMLSLIKDWE
jgi:hypothetical protein